VILEKCQKSKNEDSIEIIDTLANIKIGILVLYMIGERQIHLSSTQSLRFGRMTLRGIRKVQKASMLELRPNPAKDFVTVYYRTDKIKEQKEMRLMDLNGKVLQSIALKYSEDQVVFSLREYAVGTYIISLYANGKIQASEKLIIQK